MKKAALIAAFFYGYQMTLANYSKTTICYDFPHFGDGIASKILPV
jgi:hypothetical protein